MTLRVTGLTVPALLSGIDLTVAPGEILAVTGPSGAGKSVLARAILGLVPRGGCVTLDGAPVTDAMLGRRIGYLPQQITYLDPLAPVGRQLRWAARRAGVAAPPGGGHFPHQLSGGMARQAMLAIATIAAPALLVADEPTVGLDPDARAQVLRALRDHADRGGAALVVTHDLAAVLPVCDRVALMDLGMLHGTARARDFHGAGDALPPRARAQWLALPQNSFGGAFAKGAITGLCGPTGSGKTTLGRSLAGSGTQYLHQFPLAALNPRWPVRRSLAEAGPPDPALAAALGVAPEWLDRLPQGLSGGEIQRVSILRGLLARPHRLIADEITASLDPVAQAAIWHALGDLAARRRIAVLAISHDAALLDRIAHRVLHLPSPPMRAKRNV